MSLSRTVSKINGDFSRKSRNFPTPEFLPPPMNEFPLELSIGARVNKTKMMELPDLYQVLQQASPSPSP